MDVTPSLSVKLDPGFAFPDTVVRAAVVPLSLVGDCTFLLSSFIITLLLFLIVSMFLIRSGSMFSSKGILGKGPGGVFTCYIGKVEGETGLWIGLEVPVGDDWDDQQAWDGESGVTSPGVESSTYT